MEMVELCCTGTASGIFDGADSVSSGSSLADFLREAMGRAAM